MDTGKNTGRGSGFKDFMNSSSLIARVSFILLVIIIFIVILQLSIAFFVWWFNPGKNPHLLDGMIRATDGMIVPQDPKMQGAKTLVRSVNGPNGVEFTWSVWLFIDGNGISNDKSGDYKHIFSKGNINFSENGLTGPNNAPGLYMAPKSNTLYLIMNTYNKVNETVTVKDIPLNKWVNVIIRCRNTNLDVYINGVITKSLKLTSVPKQNYGDVNIAMNGGFDGFISNLWYYSYALGTAAIYNLVKAGPNTNMATPAMNKTSNYLSTRWFFAGAGDQYNPLRS
jgi:hypothetical protein